MVKHTQTIADSIAVTDELFDCVWPFCGVGSWRVKVTLIFPRNPVKIWYVTWLEAECVVWENAVIKV